MCDEEGGHESSFIWENQYSWVFSNSDNSGGSEEKSGKKVKGTTSSNISDCQLTAVVDETEPVMVALLSEKKRKRGESHVDDHVNLEEGKGGVGGGSSDSDHGIHTWTERERRKKMRNMFSNLHSLLPQLPLKVDKSSIVDEAINYIKILQNTLLNLQKQKLGRLEGVTTMNYDPASIISPQKNQALDSSREAFMADQGSSSNLSTITLGNYSQISNPNFPTMFQTWTSPNVILNVCGDDAHISVCCMKKVGLLSTICCVLEKHKLELVSAQLSSDQSRSMYMIQAHASGAPEQIAHAFPVEEIFKQAAGEIMLLANSL